MYKLIANLIKLNFKSVSIVKETSNCIYLLFPEVIDNSCYRNIYNYLLAAKVVSFNGYNARTNYLYFRKGSTHVCRISRSQFEPTLCIEDISPTYTVIRNWLSTQKDVVPNIATDTYTGEVYFRMPPSTIQQLISYLHTLDYAECTKDKVVGTTRNTIFEIYGNSIKFLLTDEFARLLF
jgi:hypothetical protein